MSDLIERLEKAPGPSRVLDEELFELLHGRKRMISTFEQYDPSEELPEYTASVDAALTLVPPQHFWQVKQGVEWCRVVVWGLEGGDYTSRTTIFPALALCAAAVKARIEWRCLHPPADDRVADKRD